MIGGGRPHKRKFCSKLLLGAAAVLSRILMLYLHRNYYNGISNF